MLALDLLVQVSIWVCMCTLMEARGQPQMLALRSCSHFWRLSWNSLRRLDWLASESQASFCIHFPSTGVTSACQHEWLFFFSYIYIRGFWGLNSGPCVYTLLMEPSPQSLAVGFCPSPSLSRHLSAAHQRCTFIASRSPS